MSKLPKQPTPFETWAIRNKNTGEFFVAPSGKNSWKAKGHAKNAWASVCSSWSSADQKILDKYGVEAKMKHYHWGAEAKWPRFDEQDTWELIELGGSVESLGKQLKEAVDILTSLVDEEGHRPIITGHISVVIKKFLESVK